MELDYSQDEINIDYGDGETEGRYQVESNQEEGGSFGWVSHSVQNAELQPPLLCRCLCFCARGTTYTNTRRPGDLIMSNKNNDIGDDDDYPSWPLTPDATR